MPDESLCEVEDIMQAMAGQVRLMLGNDISADRFSRYLGVNPKALTEVAELAAQEEFEHAHGMGPLSVARIRGLSASQRKVVKAALVDTFEVAFRTGMVIAEARRLADGKPKGDGQGGSS